MSSFALGSHHGLSTVNQKHLDPQTNPQHAHRSFDPLWPFLVGALELKSGSLEKDILRSRATIVENCAGHELLRYVGLIAAHAQFLAVLQKNQVITVKPGLDLFNHADIYDGGTVNPYKVARIELALKSAQGFADLVGGRPRCHTRLLILWVGLWVGKSSGLCFN